MKKPQKKQFQEARVKYEVGSPTDEMVRRLETHFGIARPALVKMAIKKLVDVTFDGRK